MSIVVNVVGLGYIGLPTALMIASSGVKVTGTDTDKDKIDALNNGVLTFEEGGIEELYNKANDNDIHFSEKYIEADVYIIAVPTPYDKKTRKVVASYLVTAIEGVIDFCKSNSIIVVESTVSPGTIDLHVRPIVTKKNKDERKNISVAHAPERIIPGSMIRELTNNNRIIGSDDARTGQIIKKLYQRFCFGEIIITDIRTAELTKVAENTFRDINIAYANELVKICREAQIDVYELIRLANMHPRVNILSPGPGVGGHCISVDPWFLVGDYPEIANLILTSRKVNDSMPEYVLRRISSIMKENNISSMSDVGLYGLTYKENVDDIRESPTLQLISCMESHGAFGVKVYDPFVKGKITSNQFDSLDLFLEQIKLVVIMVGHEEIRLSQNRLREHIVFDTRNIVDIPNRYTL